VGESLRSRLVRDYLIKIHRLRGTTACYYGN